MYSIHLKIRNAGTYDFIGEITDTGEGYKFTMPDGNGMEIYKNLIEEIKVENETEEISVLGEAPRWHARGDVPRYNEYERDKVEKMR